MKILVTGGAGYIGTHTVVQLVHVGHHVVVVDNFANSSPEVQPRVEALTGEPLDLREFDLCDQGRTERLFAEEQFEAVIHFAGYKAVGESVAQPLDYYENNLGSTFSLLRAMQAHGAKKFVFSSSATVYGTNQAGATEDQRTSATNPYGWTKVMQEQILRDAAVADPTLKIALLRYFNPVGAHASGTIGEDPLGVPSNLMPYVAQVAIGKREKLEVFGGDYQTSDGTGVRDFIHVEDLAAGHVAALDALGRVSHPVNVWNLGTGRGTSVLELLHAFEKVVGNELPYEIVGRRAGDVAVSFADPSKANRELGWRAERTVASMCADVWRWQSQNPLGLRTEAD